MIIRLANTDDEAVYQDIRKLVSDWNGGRTTYRLTWDKGEFHYEDEEYTDEETGETYTREVKVYTVEPSGKLELVPLIEQKDEEGNTILVHEPHKHVSGARIDICPAGKRVIIPAEYDEEGNVVKEAVVADELRYDIHVPDEFELPKCITQVTPKSPDRGYANPVTERELDIPDNDWNEEDAKHWAKIRNIPVTDELTKDETLQAILDYFNNKKGAIEWEEGIWLDKDAEIVVDEKWYKVNIGHHTQSDWRPPNNLFTEIPTPGDIDDWTQPEGSHDAYPLGYIVRHNDTKWQSNHPANVWEPPTYWTKIPEGGTEEIPEWSSFESHEFQSMGIGTAVIDEGDTYYLTDPAQGHWKPSGDHGHHGWSLTKPE